VPAPSRSLAASPNASTWSAHNWSNRVPLGPTPSSHPTSIVVDSLSRQIIKFEILLHASPERGGADQPGHGSRAGLRGRSSSGGDGIRDRAVEQPLSPLRHPIPACCAIVHSFRLGRSLAAAATAGPHAATAPPGETRPQERPQLPALPCRQRGLYPRRQQPPSFCRRHTHDRQGLRLVGPAASKCSTAGQKPMETAVLVLQ
jgi:hypothetical protein